MKMKAFEVVGEALAAEGVDTIFGLMTSDNMALFGHLAARGIKVVRARTEHGVICMADGYARATGRLGVASVGAGPSAAMTATALVTAQRRRSPLVVICGDVPVSNRHHLKGFDQEEYFRNAAGHCLTVASTRTVIHDTYQVLRRARSGSGPAVLNVPVDLLEAEVDMEDIGGDWRYMSPWTEPPAPVAPAASIEQVAQLLRESERPLILAGRGAAEAGARDAILRCAQKVGALLGTSVQGQYLFDHEFDVGVVGSLGFGPCMELVDQADLVVAVGAGFNVYTSSFLQLFPKAKLVHIDKRPEALGYMTPVDVAVLADARQAMEAVGEVLEQTVGEDRVGFRTEETRRQIAAARNSLKVDYVPGDKVLDPRQVLDLLQQRLPEKRMDVVDAGHFLFFVMDHIRSRSPQDRIWTADFASIGISLGAGIGAAVARPDRHVTVFVGDGGFMMSLLELDTAARHRIPMTVVVMNDEAYGAEVRYLENRKESYDLACFQTPDLEAVAKGLGCEAATVRTVGELEAACERIGRTEVPLVLDIRINPRVAHRHYVGRRNSAADK
ncbi:MAG TPA: thiamine pyrophosphate-binding protein [Ramlibacter sp.]|nr:thiamine pyrophosphate-binding protein [Ramlibacter sp.]